VVVEEVSVELEEVSVEGALVVSVVEALLTAVVSLLVVPSTENVSPKAPEAISPNANKTARPIPILTYRFRNVRSTLSAPCFTFLLITPRRLSLRPPEPHPARRGRAATPGGRVKLGKIS